MSTTADGRCWDCIRRLRWYPDLAVELGPEAPRHLVLADGSALCAMPRKARGPRAEAMTRYRKDYIDRTRRERPDVWALYRRRKDIRQRYGITFEDFVARLDEQQGICACCKTAPATDIDHDHATGAVRGILCAPCNRGLGQFGDDVGRLRAGIRYLTA